MVSLKTVGRRFEIPLEVIEGGSGGLSGEITETPQDQVPSYIFISPRHIVRTRSPNLLRTGMVIRTPANMTFIVGNNGPSETSQGTIWTSYRLFEVSGQYSWKRRTRVIDPITTLEREGPLQDLGMVWMALEPLDREAFDRKIRASIEQSRFIAGAAIEADDLIDDQPVIRSDVQLGLRIGVIS